MWCHICRSDGSDLEEGEIEEPDAEAAAVILYEWDPDKQAHAWLALALFERLSGSGLRAQEAADKALAAAAGSPQVCTCSGNG